MSLESKGGLWHCATCLPQVSYGVQGSIDGNRRRRDDAVAQDNAAHSYAS
jgi:hypothetical protein